jgi:hypothetical protein
MSQKVRVTVDHNARKRHDHIHINFETNYDDKDFMLYENFGPPCNVTFKLVYVAKRIKITSNVSNNKRQNSISYLYNRKN